MYCILDANLYHTWYMESILSTGLWMLFLLMAWVLPWKGFALWTAARNSHKGWFIAILLINTLALLDIFYLIFIAKVFHKKSDSVDSQ